jgi:hypothetical protein
MFFEQWHFLSSIDGSGVNCVRYSKINQLATSLKKSYFLTILQLIIIFTIYQKMIPSPIFSYRSAPSSLRGKRCDNSGKAPKLLLTHWEKDLCSSFKMVWKLYPCSPEKWKIIHIILWKTFNYSFFVAILLWVMASSSVIIFVVFHDWEVSFLLWVLQIWKKNLDHQSTK